MDKTKTLLCPVLSAAGKFEKGQSCIKSKCSWWDNRDENCVVFSILKATRQVTEDGRTTLDDLERILSSK